MPKLICSLFIMQRFYFLYSLWMRLLIVLVSVRRRALHPALPPLLHPVNSEFKRSNRPLPFRHTHVKLLSGCMDWWARRCVWVPWTQTARCHVCPPTPKCIIQHRGRCFTRWTWTCPSIAAPSWSNPRLRLPFIPSSTLWFIVWNFVRSNGHRGRFGGDVPQRRRTTIRSAFP